MVHDRSPRHICTLSSALTGGLLLCAAQAAAGLGDPPDIPGGDGGFDPPVATLISGGVETEYLDLQAAINDAIAGDRIALEARTWEAGLVIDGKSNLQIEGPSANSMAVIQGDLSDRGIIVTNSSDIAFNNLMIRACAPPSTPASGLPTGRGGGVLISSGNRVSFTTCDFEDNFAAATGGAAAIDLSVDTAFDACSFSRNEANGQDGGAISSNDSDGLSLSGCMFTSNIASAGYGGAVAVHSPSGIASAVSGCLFDSNTARLGGGIAAIGANGTSSGEILIGYSSFMGNRGTFSGGSGAALYMWGPMYSEVNATVFSRNHSMHGGAIKLFGGYIELSGCLLVGNRGTEGADILSLLDNATSLIQNSFTDCQSTLSASVNGTWTDGGGNELIPHCGYTADIDLDGTVGVGDLMAVLTQWGNEPLQDADIAREPGETASVVDAADLVQIIQAWGDSSGPVA